MKLSAALLQFVDDKPRVKPAFQVANQIPRTIKAFIKQRPFERFIKDFVRGIQLSEWLGVGETENDADGVGGGGLKRRVVEPFHFPVCLIGCNQRGVCQPGVRVAVVGSGS